jgi:hypothetical protein
MGLPNFDDHGIASECNSPHPLASRRAKIRKPVQQKNSRAAPAESTQFKRA